MNITPFEAVPLFIFEMANNHQGSLEHGLRIIEAMGRIARTHQINAAVKFQYRELETFIHPTTAKNNKHIARFQETRMPKGDYRTMVEAVKAQGMKAMCTPFDESSVDDIVNHGVDIVKVASCSANDWSLLEKIAAARRPIILSTGGLRLDEIDQVVTFLEHRSPVALSILHCVGIYPTPVEMLNLNFIDRMRRRYYQYSIGYSGHESPNDLDVVKIAVAKGAKILERHIGLPTDKIKLNAYSMDPEQTDRWVQAALVALKICGNVGADKMITQAECDSLHSLRRGAFVRESVAVGEPITPERVYYAFPCQPGQTTAAEYHPLMSATRAYQTNEAIVERRIPTTVATLRTVIREAKGMLREAGIQIGSQFTVEMSHHWGPENFRRFGCVMVNIVNREYCKKLLLMIPGQQHPNHRHHQKEETFQVLWGELDVILDGKSHHLKSGDILLIGRAQWHSFSTTMGCIIEEISTTHVHGDSEYEDQRIAILDPMQRKTVLEGW